MSEDNDILKLVGCKDVKSLDKYLVRIGNLETDQQKSHKKTEIQRL